ncbi:MAG: DUF4349 domain-containing protein, partial [Victivallales bacterium]|nr:DUF4349 domain-containing protein [Victivallales bacterium]
TMYNNTVTSSFKASDSVAAESAYGGDYWFGETENLATQSTSDTDSRSNIPDGVKMIYRAEMRMETQEFDTVSVQIRTLVAELGGYLENQSVRGSGYRSASYTVRVPADKFDTFLSAVGNYATVTYQSQSEEDVSEYYYDMESRLETAKIKLDRLQELLSRADKMEDIITLESAISDTEYQIEQLSGEIRHYDALIGYSTINVELNEVYRVTDSETAPLTFGQRIANAFHEGLRDFGDTLEDLAEWLAYSWIGILIFIAAIVCVVKLGKRRMGKLAKKKLSTENSEQTKNE